MIEFKTSQLKITLFDKIGEAGVLSREKNISAIITNV